MLSLQQDADYALYNLLSQSVCGSLLPSAGTRMPGGTFRGAPIGVVIRSAGLSPPLPPVQAVEACFDLLEYGESMAKVERYGSQPGMGHLPIFDT